ncbi:MAG: VWA domain-containing protein [Vicinamibacterales bacterium]
MLVLSGIIAARHPDHAQQFRAGVTLRVLDVVVTAADGQPARNLERDDFEIIDDGAPVAIRYVTPVETPAPTGRDDTVFGHDPAVWTNAGTATRRVFAVVLDDLNTRAGDTDRARSIARSFVERLPPGDLAAIVYTGQQTGAQEFTADKAHLARSLEHYVGRHPVPDLDLVTDGAAGSLAATMRGTLGGEVRANYERTMQTLLNVTQWLSAIEGRRKSILFVTAALDPALAQAFLGGVDGKDAGGAGMSALFARLVGAAATANVAIYPLDYQGLSGPMSRDLPTPRAGGLNPLTVLADETGGVASVNTNVPGRLFDRMIQDASAYYLVGYEAPADGRRDTRRRARQVRVRVRSNELTARARRTYLVGREDPVSPRTAAALLSSPVPGGALTLDVQVSPFPRANGKARALIVLEVAGDALERSLSTPGKDVSVDYRVTAADVEGRIRAAEARTVTIRLSQQRLAQRQPRRLRIFAHVELDPGSYRLRAAVVTGDAHGTVAGDVDIPDVRHLRLAVSPPLLASSAAATIPVRREDYEPFRGRLSAAPTTGRVFDAGDSIEAYLEVWAGRDGTGAEGPAAHAVIVDAAGTEVADVPTFVGAAGRGLAGGLVFPVKVNPSLAGLRDGRYELRVVVASSGGPPVTRRLPFVLRP